jgi:hypothetical protein
MDAFLATAQSDQESAQKESCKNRILPVDGVQETCSYWGMALVTGYKTKKPKHVGAARRMTQTQAARVLNVSRGHLNRVLHGARHSDRLLVLYRELMAAQAVKTKSKT